MHSLSERRIGMDVTVSWSGGGMGFSGTGGESGFSVPLGSMEEGMRAPGMSPMEMLLVSLGGCTGMDVVSILKKKRQEVTAFEVRVHGERAQGHPRVYTRIMVEYAVTGRHVDPAAVRRAVELSRDTYCSVMAMLGKAAAMETKIIVKEAPDPPA